jgi:transposase InsO family protein
MELVPYGGILYATDRRPASEDDNEKYYVDELLDGEIFYALKEARILVEQWRVHYNTIRPHSSLGYRPPAPQAINPLVMPALAPQQ